MRHRVALLVTIWLLMPVLAQAVDIQYVLSSGDVIAASDTALDSVEGYGIATIVGVTAASIVWPGPTGSPHTAACPGQSEWTRLTNPNGTTIAALGLVVRAGLLFFQTTSPLLTGCHLVTSKHQINRLVDQAIVTGVPDSPTIAALNVHFAWYYGRCGDAPTNQNCLDWKTQLNILVSRYPGRTQGMTAATQAATLVTDSNTFVAAQCSAQPGGSFC